MAIKYIESGIYTVPSLQLRDSAKSMNHDPGCRPDWFEDSSIPKLVVAIWQEKKNLVYVGGGDAEESVARLLENLKDESFVEDLYELCLWAEGEESLKVAGESSPLNYILTRIDVIDAVHSLRENGRIEWLREELLSDRADWKHLPALAKIAQSTEAFAVYGTATDVEADPEPLFSWDFANEHPDVFVALTSDKAASDLLKSLRTQGLLPTSGEEQYIDSVITREDTAEDFIKLASDPGATAFLTSLISGPFRSEKDNERKFYHVFDWGTMKQVLYLAEADKDPKGVLTSANRVPDSKGLVLAKRKVPEGLFTEQAIRFLSLPECVVGEDDVIGGQTDRDNTYQFAKLCAMPEIREFAYELIDVSKDHPTGEHGRRKGVTLWSFVNDCANHAFKPSVDGLVAIYNDPKAKEFLTELVINGDISPHNGFELTGHMELNDGFIKFANDPQRDALLEEHGKEKLLPLAKGQREFPPAPLPPVETPPVTRILREFKKERGGEPPEVAKTGND